MTRGPGTAEIKVPLWAALQAREAPASIGELANEIGAPANSVQLRLLSWARAGFLSVTYIDRKHYLMTQASRGQPAPPVIDIRGKPAPDRAGRDRMWRAMRTLRRFDLPTLRMTAEVSRRSAEDFINCLLRAGMLTRLARGSNHRFTWSLYELNGKPGPRTPIVRHRATEAGRRREVHDPNTGQSHDISPRRRAPFFDAGS